MAERIIFVDDEQAACRWFRRFCRENFPQRTAVVFADPSEAAGWIEQNTANVSAVVADQRMDEMPGTELLDIVRRLIPKAARVLYSAYPRDAEVMDAVREGLVHVAIAKPNEDALKQHLQRRFRQWSGPRRRHISDGSEAPAP